MKLLTILLLFPFFLHAQSKGDAKITVTPSDTAKLFDKLITLLYTEGYVVKVEDKARGIIITEEKPLEAWYNPDMRLKLMVSDVVTLTGEVKPSIELNGVKFNWMQIENKGAKKTAQKASFDAMDKLAKLIGDKIVYSK